MALLLQPDAVLAGDAAADADDIADDLILQLVDPFEGAWLAQIAEYFRVDVAIACVGQVSHLIAGMVAHLRDLAEGFGQA
jgi:hypothetical protein